MSSTSSVLNEVGFPDLENLVRERFVNDEKILHSRYIRMTFTIHSGDIQVTFIIHSGDIQEHSKTFLNIQNTFRGHSSYIHDTFK